MHQHTILFLAANPLGTKPRALEREARAIRTEMQRTLDRHHFNLVTCLAAESLDLLRELRSVKPTILHFSGQCSSRRGLYFQGPDGRRQPVSSKAFQETLGAISSSLRVVVLNACYSDAHAHELLAHVDCVIGMTGSISNEAARAFAAGFYGGLGDRQSVARAFQQGRAAIDLETIPNSGRPQLKVREGVDADTIFLVTDPIALSTASGPSSHDDEVRATRGMVPETTDDTDSRHHVPQGNAGSSVRTDPLMNAAPSLSAPSGAPGESAPGSFGVFVSYASTRRSHMDEVERTVSFLEKELGETAVHVDFKLGREVPRARQPERLIRQSHALVACIDETWEWDWKDDEPEPQTVNEIRLAARAHCRLFPLVFGKGRIPSVLPSARAREAYQALIKEPSWRIENGNRDVQLRQLCNKICESAHVQQLSPAPRGLSHMEGTTLRGALLGVVAGAAALTRTNASLTGGQTDEPFNKIPKGWARLVVKVHECIRQCREPVATYGISSQLAYEALAAPALFKATLGDDDVKRLETCFVDFHGLIENSRGWRELRDRTRTPVLKAETGAEQYFHPLPAGSPAGGFGSAHEELNHRQRRMDIAVLCDTAHTSPFGLLLGLQCEWTGTEDSERRNLQVEAADEIILRNLADSENWRPIGDEFRAGLENGRRAAARLLETLGMTKESLRKFNWGRILVSGLLPPFEVDDRSAGLAVALDVLATALRAPRATVLSVGSVDTDGVIEMTPPGLLAAKAAAAATDGVNSAILCNAPPDLPDSVGVEILSRQTLAEAAALYFRERWSDFAATTQGERWKRLGFRLGDCTERRNAAKLGNRILEGRNPKVTAIVGHLTTPQPQPFRLMDKAQRGKTWLAHQVCCELESQNWKTLLLATLNSTFEVTEELSETIQASLAGATGRKLLVIDGIEWRGPDSGACLRRLADALDATGIAILFVCRSDDYSGWEEDRADSWAKTDAQEKGFAGKLVEILVHDYSLEAVAPMLGAIKKLAGENLWIVSHLIAHVAQHSPLAITSTTELQQSFLHAHLSARIDETRFQEARMLAALSRYGIWADAARFSSRAATYFERLGAVRDKDQDSWRIPSMLICDTLLQAEFNKGQLKLGTNRYFPSHVAVEYLAVYVADAVKNREYTVVLEVLTALEPWSEVVNQLTQAARSAFSEWIALPLMAKDLARALSIVSEHLEASDRHAWGVKLAACLTMQVQQTSSALDPHTLRDAMRVLMTCLDNGDDDNGNDSVAESWERLLEELQKGGLRNVLKNGENRARARLYKYLEPISNRSRGLRPVLLSCMDIALKTKEKYQVDDHRAALELAAVVKRLDRNQMPGEKLELQVPRVPQYSIRPFASVLTDSGANQHTATGDIRADLDPDQPPDDLEDSAAHRYDTRPFTDALVRNEAFRQMMKSNTGHIESIVYQAVTDLELEHRSASWKPIADELKQHFPAVLPQAKLSQISRAFVTFGAQNRKACINIVNRLRLVDEKNLLYKINRGQPNDVASFLDTIARLHGRQAFEFLYKSEDNRNRQRGRSRHKQEPRKNWAIKSTVAHELARALMRDSDGRGAGRLLDATARIDAIYGSARHGFANWLGEKELGREFFRSHLDIDRRTSVIFHLLNGAVMAEVDFLQDLTDIVIDRVVNSIRASSPRPWAPRLALLLARHPELGAKFVEKLRVELPARAVLEAVLKARQLEGLRYLLELALLFPGVTVSQNKDVTESRFVSAFLRNATPHPELRVRGLLLLSQHYRRWGLDSHADNLVKECKRGWHAKLEAADAANTAAFLRDLVRFDPDSANAVVAVNKRLLRHRIQRSYEEPEVATDIIDAVNAASPIGANILSALQADRLGWHRFLDLLAHEQDPRLQARCFRRLARLGVKPDEKVMQNVYGRWSGETGLSAITSPTALSDLLSMFMAWDDVNGTTTAEQAAKLVDIERVSSRLKEGAMSDLASASSLISALQLCRQEQNALALARVLPPTGLSRLDITAMSELAGVLFSIDAALAARQLNAATERIQHAIRCPVVLDEVTYWTSLGWLAYYKHLSGSPLLLPPSAPTLEFVRAPGLRAWALGLFDGQSWAQQLAELAIEGTPTDRAQILALKLHHGVPVTDHELRSALAPIAGRAADARTLQLVLDVLDRAGRSIHRALCVALRDAVRGQPWSWYAVSAARVLDGWTTRFRADASVGQIMYAP